MQQPVRPPRGMVRNLTTTEFGTKAVWHPADAEVSRPTKRIIGATIVWFLCIKKSSVWLPIFLMETRCQKRQIRAISIFGFSVVLVNADGRVVSSLQLVENEEACVWIAPASEFGQQGDRLVPVISVGLVPESLRPVRA